MELQLAFDAIALQRALEVTRQVADLVDIIEMGTPFLFTYSVGILRAFRESAPDVRIMADFKILDGGEGLARLAFAHGADMVSVSGRTWPRTIRGAIDAARECGKRVLVDFEGTPPEQFCAQVRSVDALRPDYLCIHRMFGAQDDVRGQIRQVRENARASKLALAGGMDETWLKRLKDDACLPDLLICGKAITQSASPRDAVERLLEIVKE